MDAARLIKDYPVLYHMAEDGSWPSIVAHGLLSTSALLSLYGYQGALRGKLESEWRAEKVTIHREGLPDAILRDQKPMPPVNLAPTLTDGMTPSEWYRLINGKVFFWLDCEDLEKFMDAREYRNSPQLAITVDAERLLNGYFENITLCGINSGSTYIPSPRGPRTFRTIPDYESAYAKELCVQDGISDIRDLVISVHRMKAVRNDYNSPRNVKELERLYPI